MTEYYEFNFTDFVPISYGLLTYFFSLKFVPYHDRLYNAVTAYSLNTKEKVFINRNLNLKVF